MPDPYGPTRRVGVRGMGKRIIASLLVASVLVLVYVTHMQRETIVEQIGVINVLVDENERLALRLAEVDSTGLRRGIRR